MHLMFAKTILKLFDLCVCVLQRQVRRVHRETPALLDHQDWWDRQVRSDLRDSLVRVGRRERWLSIQTDREDRLELLDPTVTPDHKVISIFVIVVVVSDVTETTFAQEYNSIQFIKAKGPKRPLISQ